MDASRLTGDPIECSCFHGRGTWDVGVGSGLTTGLRRHPRVPIFRLFIADVVINFESISHPVVRITCVVAFLIYLPVYIVSCVLVSAKMKSTGEESTANSIGAADHFKAE